jgi:uncharacterized protein
MNTFWDDITGNRAVRAVLVAVLALLALYLLALALGGFGALGHKNTPPTNTITVTGTGTAALAPDIAHITFAVQNTAATVADAQAAVTKQGNAAIEYVKGQGIDDKDVTTLSYNITPQYSYTRCVTPQVYSATSAVSGVVIPPCTETSKVTGYQVSETVQVTVRDLTKISDLLAGLGKQGVQNVNGPDFTLSNPNAGSDAARGQAIDSAKAEAQTLAKELGVHLGDIVSFNENNGSPIVYGMGGAMMDKAAMSAAAPTPVIPVGTNTYTSTVYITYEIR